MSQQTETLAILFADIAGSTVLTVANGFTNHGTIDLTTTTAGYSTVFAVTNGTLVNATDGVLVSSVGSGGSRTLTAELNNQGTFTVNFVRGGSATLRLDKLDQERIVLDVGLSAPVAPERPFAAIPRTLLPDEPRGTFL